MMKMMMMIVLFECAIIQNEKERALRSIAQTFVRRAIRRSERQRDNASNLTPAAVPVVVVALYIMLIFNFGVGWGGKNY